MITGIPLELLLLCERWEGISTCNCSISYRTWIDYLGQHVACVVQTDAIRLHAITWCFIGVKYNKAEIYMILATGSKVAEILYIDLLNYVDTDVQ